MRRSICSTEPSLLLAGSTGNWKFLYTTATNLPKNTKIRFDFASRGDELDWQIPSPNLKEKKNCIWGEVEGTLFSATQIDVDSPHSPSYEFTLPIELKSGESFSLHVGTKEKNPQENGNIAQKLVQRKRPFYLYLDPKGKGDYKEPEIFHLDVKGNHLHNLRIITPSLVSRNKRFDVIVRFEDQYGNLTSLAPQGTLIELSYEHLRENLNWKLFVPETGFLALPNLYFNEPGVYKIQLKNLQTKEVFYSSPIQCVSETTLHLYWGLLHGESDRFLDNLDTFFRYMRDEKALQFVATSFFEIDQEGSLDSWKELQQKVSEFNEEDRFVSFLGFQWLGDVPEEGLRQFLYGKDGKPLLRKKETKSNSLKKIYKTHTPKELVSIPSLTMGSTTCYNFAEFDPVFEPVVEIYNSWGSSECTKKEGNKKPISSSRKGIAETKEGSCIAALNRGCRFGFVAGGTDHRGIYRSLSEQTEYSPGLTAILAKEHSRAALIEALQARSCYATTGPRMILGLSIASHGMGSILETKSRPGLQFHRHLVGHVVGTTPLKEVLLIRNGEPLHSFPLVKQEKLEFTFDDPESLYDIALTPSPDEERVPFIYYYLRIEQSDGHVAWTSPIWIDWNAQTTPMELLSQPKKSKKK